MSPASEHVALPEPLARLMNGGTPILLWGERGTGKTALARLIHHPRSRRRCEPFVVVDCATVHEDAVRPMLCGVVEQGVRVPGLFDSVGAGSILFEDIDRCGSRMQFVLRDVLDFKGFRPDSGHERIPFAGRILATSSSRPSPENMVPAFYYHVFKHRLDSLRDREDLPVILCDALRRSAVAARRSYIEGFEAQALDRLARYAWPGNFRELRHAVDIAVHRCDVPLVRLTDLPAEIVAHAHVVGLRTVPWPKAA